MRLISTLITASFLLLSLGCGGADKALDAQAGFKDKVCACADLACAKAVSAEQQKWVAENGQAFAGATEEDAERLAGIEKEMSGCLQKLAAAGK